MVRRQRRPYSIGSTAGLRFPALPIDVAAANLSGDNGEDTVNGGYAWVLTASGTIYLVNIDPVPRIIKAVVHDEPDGAVPRPRTPIEAFVVQNGVPDSASLVREATPYPEPAARSQRDRATPCRSIRRWGPRASTCRRCS